MPEIRLLDPDGYTVPGTAQTVPDADVETVRAHLKTVVAPQHAAQWADFGYQPDAYRVLPELSHLNQPKEPAMDTNAVFTAAATATNWTATNLGPRTTVSHAGYTWTVELPATGQGAARITGRDGYGGTEFLNIPATAGQTVGIVEAAMSALRTPVTVKGATRVWEVEADGMVVASGVTEEAAKGHVKALLMAGRMNPSEIRVEWACALCEGYGECPNCESDRPGPLMAYVNTDGVGRYGTKYTIQPAA